MPGTPDRLLIVDDEAEFARYVERVAEGLGLAVLSLQDAAEFEKTLGLWDPTIVMLDVNMPKHDGLELLGTLAARHFPGRIIVVSGAAPEYLQMTGASARVRGLNLAAVRAKPIRAAELRKLLLELMTGDNPPPGGGAR